MIIFSLPENVAIKSLSWILPAINNDILIYQSNFKLQFANQCKCLYFPAQRGDIKRILKGDWYISVL
ncbi:dehydrogenase [Xenorhabdus kozodoii]|uniref:Dehydrogenase n=1 Tax=Xenorhabdus kozodoii TaxID=351676 RepID=A0A2D0LBW2_9GAMM|nr:dehydrogenase [Xenorhabdus kozodoii]